MSQSPTVSETMWEDGPETPEFCWELVDRYAVLLIAAFIVLILGCKA